MQGTVQEREHGELGKLELLSETPAKIRTETENAQMERHRQGVCLGLQELPRKRGVCVVGGQPGQSKGQTARPEQQGFLFQQAACLLQQGIRRAHHCAQSHTGNRGHQGGRGKKDVPHDRRGSAARPDGVSLSVRQTGIPVLMPDRSAP